MSFEANRRRFLALASLVISAGAATDAHGQGSGGDYSSQSSTRRPAAPAQPAELPPGIPENPLADVIKDIGPWHIVSTANRSKAWIPAERLKISSGGVEGSVPGGSTFRSTAPAVNVLDENGRVVGTTAPAPDDSTKPDDDRRILVGGRAELSLEYLARTKRYEGVLKVTTTSNGQGAMPVKVLLDGRVVKEAVVHDFAEFDVGEFFGPDLAALARARTLAVTADIDGTHTIYEVELADTPAALDQMRIVPDYNYNVRRLGREAPGKEMQDAQNPPQPTNCFLTTACCEIVGLADDCFELTALRRFRDRVMAADASGRRDVARYYEMAPRVLSEMGRRGETERLLPLYFGTILPCALLATLGLTRPTRFLYTRMMRGLTARYG